jgi:hypothetical protein
MSLPLRLLTLMGSFVFPILLYGLLVIVAILLFGIEGT